MKQHKPISQIDTIEQTLIEELGEFAFLHAILRALDYDTKEEIFDYIARCYDIDTYEDRWNNFEEEEEDEA